MHTMNTQAVAVTSHHRQQRGCKKVAACSRHCHIERKAGSTHLLYRQRVTPPQNTLRRGRQTVDITKRGGGTDPPRTKDKKKQQWPQSRGRHSWDCNATELLLMVPMIRGSLSQFFLILRKFRNSQRSLGLSKRGQNMGFTRNKFHCAG